MSSLFPARSLRLLFAPRPSFNIFRPPTPRIPQHQHLFSTALLLRQPVPPPANDTPSPDGLRNNRDLHSAQPPTSPHPAAAAQPGTPVGVSRADAELLRKLDGDGDGARAADVPSYAMVFTCKQCGERSAHRVSKQGYHHGTVLITCPSCKSRHLMSDHLKVILGDRFEAA
jgi:protein import protein ZIM17